MDTAARSRDEVDEGGPLVVSLLTLGSPTAVTGGHLYHRRMAEAAGAHGARVDFVSAGLRNPLGHAQGVLLVDSLAAWAVAPHVVARRRPVAPLAAILHQPPGGVGQRAIRTAVQRPLDELLYRRCDVLIAASQALADDLVDKYELPADRIHVVEPGCDLPAVGDVPGDLREGRRIGLLCVGNWLPNKGVLDLLDALSTLPQDDVTLHLVGRTDIDVGYASRVRARIAAPDLAGRVVVHGVVTAEQVARLYAAADAFALPSYVETYGTVYAEALSAGLPTIGWRSGNLANLIVDGEHGCLVDPGDIVGLSAALGRVATDDHWRAELASAARRRGKALPTWRTTAERFFGVLGRLAHSRDL